MAKKLSRYFIVLCTSLLSYPITRPWQEQLKTAIENISTSTSNAWIHESVKKQLLPFKDGITRSMLHATSIYSREIARFAIINGTVYSSLENAKQRLGPGISPGGVGYHPSSLAKMNVIHRALKDLVSCVSVSDIEFLLLISDGTVGPVHCPGPLYAFSKHQHKNPNVIMLPDPDVLKNHEYLQKQVLAGNQRYPWDKKIKKIFWRGGSNDICFFSPDTFMQSPRYKLVIFSQKNPLLADAFFHEVSGSRYAIRAELALQNLIGEHISIEDHMAYAYQVIIDGFTAAWGRTYWQLFCNSVILKQESDNIQWYFTMLQPYVHYIPLMSDISDIKEKLAWAELHPTEVQTIISNANELAKTNLSYANMLYYMYVLLTEYAKLQQFEPVHVPAQ